MAGIYLHIPFCKQKCSYCDFHFSTTYHSYKDKMVDCIEKEIQQRKTEIIFEPVNTIYFGGGTPSLLSEHELSSILKSIYSNYDVSNSAEITLEANPDDISVESLLSWNKLGINRLSIGLQSFRENDLQWMNRAHTQQEAENCVLLAKTHGFQNISVDLIYGLPNLDESIWQNHIDKVVKLGVQHVSAYCLTVEKKTLLDKKVENGSLILSDEDDQSEQYVQLVSSLKNAGFEQYEISNFCLPTYESKHNSSYWKGSNYIGIGPSAHSFDGKTRRFNIANNQKYMKAITEKTNFFESEILTPVIRFNEVILTGLRTKWGVKFEDLKTILPLSSSFQNKISNFKKKDWIRFDEISFQLINKGWLMADYIASELFESEEL